MEPVKRRSRSDTDLAVWYLLAIASAALCGFILGRLSLTG